MASYFNDNGTEVEIRTPFLANVLPLLGFSAGVSYGMITKKKPIISVGIGIAVGAVCLVPRLLLMRKALNDVREENEKKVEVVDSTNDVVNDTAEDEPVTADGLISLLEEISATNGTNQNFLPKKEYFRGVFESFSQEEKEATFDLLSVIQETPITPTEEDTLKMMEEISQLETDYGKDVIDNINARLNEIDEAVNEVKPEEETIAA